MERRLFFKEMHTGYKMMSFCVKASEEKDILGVVWTCQLSHFQSPCSYSHLNSEMLMVFWKKHSKS